MILELLGFMVIFMAVQYGRKEDSNYSFLSKQWFIIMILVAIGVVLVQKGNEKETRSRTHIEKEYNPNPISKQTSFNI